MKKIDYKNLNERIISLDLFRGFCLFGMMIIHTTAWYGLSGRSDFALYLNHALQFVVPGFIILVGAMVGVHYLPRLTSAKAARKTLKRLAWRAGQIFLIAYGFSVFFYLLFKLPGKGLSGSPYSSLLWEGLFKVLILKRTNFRMSILFLIAMLMLLSIVVVYLRKYFKHWYVALATGIVSYVLYLFLYDHTNLSDNIFPFLTLRRLLAYPFPVMAWGFYYFFGVGLGILIAKAKMKHLLRRFGFLLTLIGVFAVVVWLIISAAISLRAGHFEFPLDWGVPPPPQPYYILFGLSFSILVIGVMLTLDGYLQRVRGLNWMSLFGRHSLFTFVFHWPLVHVSLCVFSRIDASLSLRWVMIPVTIAIVYVAVVLESRWLSYRKSIKRLAAEKLAAS